MEGTVELLKAIGQIIWPILAIYVVIRFAPEVKELIRSAREREFTLELGGQKLTMGETSKRFGKLIDQLKTDVNALQQQMGSLNAAPVDGPLADEPASYAGRSVLWVDDHPDYNEYMVDDLRARGVIVDQVSSTKDAMRRARTRVYSAIISDMGRNEGGVRHEAAGLELLRTYREQDEETLFVLYCSLEKADNLRVAAFAMGANLITSSADALMIELEKAFA